MTNAMAIWLGAAIVAFLLVDYFYLDLNIPVFLGRRLLAVIEYLSFWR